MDTALAGLWPPVATPFDTDGNVDLPKLVRHSRTLLADGARGLALLGTTSEANSLTLDERRRVIDAHVEAGIPPSRLLPGTGASALGDAVALTRHAGEIGAAAVLLLPPFYYKKVSDDGLFAFVAALIERCGAQVPPVMLYHIPQMAGIGWSVDLVGRLRDAFPDIIVGMKDLSGDFDHTRGMIESFPGFTVFPGAEVYLLKALKLGAAGCISASANVNAAGIRALLDRWQEPGADALQAGLNEVRKAVESRIMIPSLKAILAERYRDPSWRAVRPPLMPLASRRATGPPRRPGGPPPPRVRPGLAPAHPGERIDHDARNDDAAPDKRRRSGVFVEEQPHPGRAEDRLERSEQCGLCRRDQRGAHDEEDQDEAELTGPEEDEQREVVSVDGERGRERQRRERRHRGARADRRRHADVRVPPRGDDRPGKAQGDDEGDECACKGVFLRQVRGDHHPDPDNDSGDGRVADRPYPLTEEDAAESCRDQRGRTHDHQRLGDGRQAERHHKAHRRTSEAEPDQEPGRTHAAEEPRRVPSVPDEKEKKQAERRRR